MNLNDQSPQLFSSLVRSVLFGTGTILLALLTVAGFAENLEKRTAQKSEKGFLLEFSGKDHLLIPKLRYDGGYPITLEAIVIPFPRDPEPSRACVVGNLQLAGVGVHYSGRRWLFHVNEGRPNNAGYASIVSDEGAELNKPVHVAGVYDGRKLNLFVDGKLQRRVDRTTRKHVPSPHDFMVGADPDGKGKPHQFFKGIIDEVRISKTARYTKDFTPPKKKFKADEYTLVLYHFDEGKGTVVKDASKNGYDGRIEGAKWVEEPQP